LRRNVERARDAGVTVRQTEDVAAFYECYLATMRRHGSPQFPKSFLTALLEAFGSDCLLLIAEYEGDPVAGLLALDHGDERYLLLNGSDADVLAVRPNDFLYWEAIRLACEAGYDRVDFGRTARGSGVSQFKRHFGGRREQLTTLVWPPHRVGRADISGYRRLQPVVQRLTPVITHQAIGPRVKEWLHE
jgi:lipid II:glycine glycyltransferase (peptidoglycan interpeptide bridge formation enzyme)